MSKIFVHLSVKEIEGKFHVHVYQANNPETCIAGIYETETEADDAAFEYAKKLGNGIHNIIFC